MAMAGRTPSMRSTWGWSIRSKNWRAEGLNVSTYRRCPSAYRVSKANELLPEPETPVMTVISLALKSTERFLRLFCFAPMMRIVLVMRLQMVLEGEQKKDRTISQGNKAIIYL